jgi:hypothetical protein
MLEEKDLKFASQQQQEGIGAGAGFGKVGGGVTAVKKKKWLHWIFKVLQQNAESVDGIREDMQ